MTPSMMMDRLQKYLQEITKEMALGELRLRPNVYTVGLPPRATPEYETVQPDTDIPPLETTLPESRDERWPYIIVTFTEAVNNEEGFRTVTMDFAFGCEGHGAKGYMDVLHLMEYVHGFLMRETWAGWPFRLTLPVTMGFYEEQADPYWMGYMSTTWDVPSIQPEVWKHGY
ncbi:hypothetical protein [Paenibacillus campinasensis]|uniref:Uncharacterized protein n=1 Tax=Paenibacillus campinasensis TaxID=66347 RepID=A0A268ELC1_9BACL|nr:hypothetical protein [Paenibacillus campinasensis]PAD73908.1 hypothetical protein CHH67_18920 [Paenibacillus campinasensis]